MTTTCNENAFTFECVCVCMCPDLSAYRDGFMYEFGAYNKFIN